MVCAELRRFGPPRKGYRYPATVQQMSQLPNIQTQQLRKPETGDFLLRKTVFLLTSSVGSSMAETLVKKAVAQIGCTPQRLVKDDIKRLASAIEPSLSEFVGIDKAARLTSALRVLVGE
jgi:hypothetical protein